MATRILHCGKNVKNCNLCVSKTVAGFRLRGVATGDVRYLAVNVNNTSYCGVKGALGEVTETRPWDDAELYNHCLDLTQIEYCNSFDLRIMAAIL